MAVAFPGETFEGIHPGIVSTVENWGRLWAESLRHQHAGRRWDAAKALVIARRRVAASGITSDRGALLEELAQRFARAAEERWEELERG